MNGFFNLPSADAAPSGGRDCGVWFSRVLSRDLRGRFGVGRDRDAEGHICDVAELRPVRLLIAVETGEVTGVFTAVCGSVEDAPQGVGDFT